MFAAPVDTGPIHFFDFFVNSMGGAIIVHVLHHLGADHLVEGLVGEGQVEGIAVDHLAHRVELDGAISQGADGSRERLAIQVEAHHVGAALECAKAVASLAAARVEEALSGADPKPLEVDGEQHARSLRGRRPGPRPPPVNRRYR